MEKAEITEKVSPFERVAGAALLNLLIGVGNKDVSEKAKEELKRLLEALAKASEVGSLSVPAFGFNKDLLFSTGVVGTAKSPVVFSDDSSAYYFGRNYALETDLARLVAEHAKSTTNLFSQCELEKILAKKESISTSLRVKLSNEQKKILDYAVTKPLVIVTGGPGTGKTSTIVKVLECILASEKELLIGLVAPTGKAASRMIQSITKTIEEAPDFYQNVIRAKEKGTLEESTIHRMLFNKTALGVIPSKEYPIDYDILVIDEGSMVDITIAQKLFSVIDKSRTKVIILGDKHQLEAVGPGSVFADFSKTDGPLKEETVTLTQSFRFGQLTPIGKLASMVNSECVSLLDLKTYFENKTLSESATQSVEMVPLGRVSGQLTKAVKDAVDKNINEYVQVLKSKDKNKIWEKIEESRFLCAQRKGINGLEALNAYAQEVLAKKLGKRNHAQINHGEVIIVRKNDRNVGVNNGDVAVIFEEEGILKAYFGDSQKTISLGLLPEFDLAFALTIHQSQGSQYPTVHVIMPWDEKSELATKELLYTGITRAESKVYLYAKDDVLEKSLSCHSKRSGGLAVELDKAMK